MHLLLATTRTQSHSHVFDRPAKTGKFMAFKMGHNHHRIRMISSATYVYLLEMLAVYRHLHIILASQAISNNQGCTHHCIIKAISDSCLQMIHRVRPGTYIEGVLSLIHISEPTRRTPISYAV